MLSSRGIPVSTWLPTLPVPKRRNGVSLFALLSVIRSEAIVPLAQTNGLQWLLLRDASVTTGFEKTPEWTVGSRTRHRGIDSTRDLEAITAVGRALAWLGAEVILHVTAQVMPDDAP